MNARLESNKYIKEINKSQCFENDKVTEIDTNTLDIKPTKVIQNSFNWKTYSNNEICNDKKGQTIVSYNNSQNDEIPINFDNKKVKILIISITYIKY